jgi:hypothetical protein
MPDRLYFKGHTLPNVIFEKPTGSETFDNWLIGKRWDEELNQDDDDFHFDNTNVNERWEWVYSISEEWKHTLFDRLVMEIDIDDAEKIIGEIGIRKVMKKYKESDYYNDDNIPDLSTDLGIRQVFYILLDETLKINEDYYEEITEEEFDEWFAVLFQEDDQEEEDEAIVPITDEELDRIGGVVAMCA